MLTNTIEENFKRYNCTIPQNTGNAARIDCGNFTITKARGLPWFVHLQSPNLESFAQKLRVPVPSKKVAVGFWETLGAWGKIKDLKINDEVFIDLDDENLKEITEPKIVHELKRIEKMKEIQTQTEIKNIDLRRVIEDRVRGVADQIASQIEERFEKQLNNSVVCEPETMVSNRWRPDTGTDLQYGVNIVCIVPYLSDKIREKIVNLGKWSIVRTPQMDYVRSIFPIAEKVYLNEIVFHDAEEAKTPYISLILNRKLLKDSEIVPKIRSVLAEVTS